MKYLSFEEYRDLLAKEDPDYVPYDVNGEYSQLFEIIRKRYAFKDSTENLAAFCFKQTKNMKDISFLVFSPFSHLCCVDKSAAFSNLFKILIILCLMISSLLINGLCMW